MCDSLFKRAINFLGCKIPKIFLFRGGKKYISYIQNYPVNIGARNSKHHVQSSSRQTSNVAQQVWAPIAGNFRFPPKNDMSLECHHNNAMACPQHPCVALLTHHHHYLGGETKLCPRGRQVQGLQVRPDLRICHDRLKCIFNAEGALNAKLDAT